MSNKIVPVACGAFLLVQVASAAPTTPPSPAASYADECGTCHVAYPTRMLTPSQWGQVLGQLEHHYGVDASLDPATLQGMARHLRTEPAATPSSATTLPRITNQPWFRQEHDEIAAGTMESPAVKSASNCQACHAGAERGDFDEHSVRIPR